MSTEDRGRTRADDLTEMRARSHALFTALGDGDLSEAERSRLRDELVKLHLPLVEHFARRFLNRGEPYDDLRIAIDEVCFALVGPNGRDGTIRVRYEMIDDGLVVEGEGHFEDRGHDTPLLSPLSMQILRAVADECSLEAGVEGPTFRLVKRRKGE